MTAFMLVAMGGAVGSVARYGVGFMASRLWPAAAWPVGTFTVNVIGGLLMGGLVGWLTTRGGEGAGALNPLLAVGLLGGFTTFSAFSLELAAMIERRDWGLATAYAGGSVVAATAAMMLGLYFARRMFA